MRYQRAELPLKLDGLASARDFFAGCFAEFDPRREILWVAHLDEDARCLHLSCHEGNEASAAFPVRDIVADALHHRSAGSSWRTTIQAVIRGQATATAGSRAVLPRRPRR